MLSRKVPQAVLSFVIIVALSHCKASSKTSDKPNTVNYNPSANGDKCDQTIKYHSDLLSATNREITADVDISINPGAKLINFSGTTSIGGPRIEFEMVIETVDCHWQADLIQGYSIYKGYIKQADGSTTASALKVESSNGKITMYDPEKNGELIYNISKWVVVP